MEFSGAGKEGDGVWNVKWQGNFLLNEIVKFYFIIGMFLINAKPIFCSEKSFSNKFSYLLICKPLCALASVLW